MRRAEELWDRSLLPPGSRVLCAVSGGADSVCLLHLLSREPELTVLCAHFNHQLRGAEAQRDEDFVRALCRDWGLPFFCGRGDVAAYGARQGLSEETAARTLRYEFLEKTAASAGADYIATAHTADDNAETLLLHLARGCGTRGLGGIPPRRGSIVRPLLSVSREEVEDYLRREGLPHVEDSTNGEDSAARNRLRHYAVPALRSVNPAFAAAAGRTARLLRADEEYLSAAAAAERERLETERGLSIPGLRALPEALRRRVLRSAAGERAELSHLEALWALCEGEDPSAELSLPGGIRAFREYEYLRFGSGETPRLRERSLEPPAELPLREAGLLLRAELLPGGTEIQSSFNTFSFSYGNICGKLTITPRREGDRLRLWGRKGSRSLHRLFCDAHIPRRQRELVPVLRDEAGILAVYGFGQEERARALPGEAQLRITIEKITEG